MSGAEFRVQGSGFRVQGSGLWWRLRRKYIYEAMPESLRIAVLSYRHPERAETTYLRQPLPERVRTASKDLFVPPIPRERGSAASIGRTGGGAAHHHREAPRIYITRCPFET